MNDNITLQINLSAGDINYAIHTVPALVEQHRDIEKRLLIVDCCRPQRTKLVDPEIKFPQEKFQKKVQTIIDISKELLEKRVVTDVYYLWPDDKLINTLSEKYLCGLYKTTHSAGATGNMSYWAALEIPDTRYVLHYDGDILLYQKTGYSWVNEAIECMNKYPQAVMTVPRLCPPVGGASAPSLHEGRPYKSFDDHWENDWFSTRHFLCDKYILRQYLPLVRGKLMFELLLRKYGRRAFPLDPEIVLFKSLSPRKAKRIILKNNNAWIMHPVDKSAEFVNVLPRIIPLIQQGIYPPAQAGYEDMKLSSWLAMLKEPAFSN